MTHPDLPDKQDDAPAHSQNKPTAIIGAAEVFQSPVHLLAFGFGTGLMPHAPGTAGTLVGVLFYYLIQPLPLVWQLACIAGVAVFGIWLCGASAARLGVHDYPGIVWDEIAGYLVAMTVAPEGTIWVIVGFVFFRLFDILKPWPIAWLDRHVKGGLGIMLDDLLAGVYTAVVIVLLDQLALITV